MKTITQDETKMQLYPSAENPAVNDIWYVKLRGAHTLLSVKVTDVTDRTIKFFDVEDTLQTRSRYDRKDVEFVEKAK